MLTFDLAEGEHAHIACDARDVDLDPDMFSALGIQIEQECHAGRRRLRIQAEADVCMVCDRTQRAFTRRIAGEHKLALLKAEEPTYERTDAYCLVLEPWQNRIDLTKIVRDTLLLAVPVRKVAPDAEDLVIPTVYGAPEEPEHSCWEALRQL